MPLLRATARLQFHKGFPIDRGVELLPYYAELGISHVYASPLLMSRPGSMHGYDIVDHDRIDPELGGEEALRRLAAGLRRHDMGLILDIVPNHMGVGGADNSWWLDTLEWGPTSPYAAYFDIDWDPPNPLLKNKILAPFLGTAYGEALQSGAIALRWDEADGRFFIDCYGEHRFPINPRDYPAILQVGDAAEEAWQGFAELGSGGRDAIRNRAAHARERLRRSGHRAAIDAAVAAFDPAQPSGRQRLHTLLERQNYRLAWWRAAADEINWRRFFDVNTLAGMRAELPEVFDATHNHILRLYAEGLIDGVRVDHVDGLAEPRAYCRKLRRRLQAAAPHRPPGLDPEPAVFWVEKILAPHERLPADWLTDGTTGYDYMNDVAAVLHDGEAEPAISALWRNFTGRALTYEQEVEAARRQIVRENLSSEWFATANALHRIARRDLATRDYTLTAIRWTLAELLAHFHAYRIYSGLAGITAPDRHMLDRAMAGARRSVRAGDRPLLELIGGWLAGIGARGIQAGARRAEHLRAMVKFQQLSAPTAAKSVEDTAFYRFGRLLSRNEVGSEPSQFALPPSSFHGANRERRKRFPRALLSTATHDHKRGEDARMRLAVLADLPAEWEAAVHRWSRLNATLKRDVDGPAPEPMDELMLYQTVVGAWPLDLSPDDREGLAAFRERIAAWQEKALREAKRRTGYAAPDEAYEGACRAFLDGLLDPDRTTRVGYDIAAFVDRIAPAGAINSLSQLLLRLTGPGIPDTYQGTEFWDFSLVDPDNRRPVDFTARRAALAANEAPAALLGSWRDGRVKQGVLRRVLRHREAAPGLFTEGGYQPLRVEGPMARHALAYARVHEGRACLAIVSRLPGSFDLDAKPLIGYSTWKGTFVMLPRGLANRAYRDVLLDSAPDAGVGRLALDAVLAQLPVALLEVR